MTDLPQLWTRAPLGDVTVEPTQRVPADDEEFAYIDIGSIDRETKRIVNPRTLRGRDAPSRARKEVRAGDVLVSMTRPNLNAVALVPESLDRQIASTGFDVLRAPAVEPRWIFYNVRAQAFIDEMTKLVRGALYPAIRSRDVRGYVAPFAPLREQTRIADKLDALLNRIDECRERLRRVEGILTHFKRAVLAEAISGGLTEDWREERGMDSEWPSTKLSMVATDFSYGSSAKSADAGLVPVLRMGNIQDGRLDWNDLVYTSDPSEIAKYRLAPGDVLFNRTNTPELVGKTAVYHGEREAIYAGYLIRVRCRDKLNPDFLGYCLNSPAGREYCWSVKADSVGQSNINARKLAAFPIRLPSVQEQLEIVQRVERLLSLSDELSSRCLATKAHLGRLTPELISLALKGKLVPQDPTDESANALLERIQVSRASAIQPVRKRVARTDKAPRAPKEKGTMTKSRHDADVKGKPYLAGFLRASGGPQTVDYLFRRAELPVPDFYKQLAWEVAEGHILDNAEILEAADAS